MTIAPKTLAWLHQSAAVKGSTYSQVLLSLLDRVEALEKKYETQLLATLEWGKDVDKLMRWIDDHLKRIMALETAQQQPHQDKLDRLIALVQDDDEPTPPAAPAGGLVEKALAKTTAILNDPGRALLTEVRETLELNLRALEQFSAPAPPVALSDALIKAECALSDVAEGEETNAAPNTFEWAEQRCAETLAIIRPVMKQYKICTSEWPGCGFSPPQPAQPVAPVGGLVEADR